MTAPPAAAREGSAGRPQLAAVCDPNGQLVDTWPATARALELACLACALPRPDVRLCPSWLSAPAEALVPALVSAPPAVQASVLALFRHLWPAAAGELARPRPGVADGLARLADAGVELWVVTHLDDGCLAAVLASTGLDGWVQGRAAFRPGDPASAAKPSASMLAALAVGRPSPARRVVVVADTACELEMARRAGRPAVATPFGRGCASALIGWKPLAWAEVPDRLAAAVRAAAEQDPPQPPAAA